MPRQWLRGDVDSYELRGAEIRRARKARPCDSPVCARNNVIIGKGERYAYVSTNHAWCDFHWRDVEVTDVNPRTDATDVEEVEE